VRNVDPFCALAAEYRVNQLNHESQGLFGIMYRRPQSFTYQANLHTSGVVSMLCEQTIIPGVIFGVTGAMAHDGNGEAQFGFALTVGA
jgi:hypothetical protein